MFGDIFASAGQLQLQFRENAQGLVGTAAADIPLGGGSRRVKIGENNSSLPVDRLIFMYNHFQGALESRISTPFGPITRSYAVDRYTFGFEKTMFDGNSSCQVMMPFTGLPTLGAGVPGSPLTVDGGDVGNLAIIFKQLLLTRDDVALAAGLGLDVPTGDDVLVQQDTTDMRIQNQALHLLPYLGFTTTPTELTFFTAFAQLDLAASGNTVGFRDRTQGDRFTSVGEFNEQNLLYLDASLGNWLIRDPQAPVLTGLAVFGELHYTGTLQDSDRVAGTFQGRGFDLNNRLNRFNIVNGTAGLQIELGNTTSLRTAGVFPLTEAPNRFFDSEFQVQLNRRF